MYANRGDSILHDSDWLDAKVAELAAQVADRHRRAGKLALVGIRTGGAHLALRLREKLEKLTGQEPPTGIVDITLYRDDWTRLDRKPKIGPTQIDFPLEGAVVVLVDDVLYTGRTTRAALDALIDFGRPQRIELLSLVDRGGRELPIQPDYVGVRVEAADDEVIDVLLTESGAGADCVVRRVNVLSPKA